MTHHNKTAQRVPARTGPLDAALAKADPEVFSRVAAVARANRILNSWSRGRGA